MFIDGGPCCAPLRRCRMKRALVGLGVAVSMLGCAAGDDVSPPLGDRVQVLDADLSLGATGEQVRTLNDYLPSHGYYPNPRLAALYPSWRPPITESPVDPSVFDDRTNDAVRLFQVNHGLAPTG